MNYDKYKATFETMRGLLLKHETSEYFGNAPKLTFKERQFLTLAMAAFYNLGVYDALKQDCLSDDKTVSEFAIDTLVNCLGVPYTQVAFDILEHKAGA